MRLKILWMPHFAGIDGANLNMVEGIDVLADLGHECHVVLPQTGPVESRLLNASSVHMLHHNQWASHEGGIQQAARWMAYNHRVAEPRIRDLAAELQADVILSNTLGVAAGGFAARRAGLPHVWFLHEVYWPQFGFRFLMGRRFTMWLVRHLASEVMCCGPSVREYFKNELPALDMPVVRCWTRVEAAETGEAPPSPGTGPLGIVLVGSLIPRKAQGDAIDAVGILRRAGRDVHLDLVGGGEERFRQGLEQRSQVAGVADRVRFAGFQEDPSPYYGRAHVALMCSVQEGLPRAAVEPLKFGRPVIAAAGGGLLDVIEEGRNGLLYRPGDPEDLARRIAELDDDRERLRQLGERGRRDALATFNAERMGAALEEVLTRVCSNGAPRVRQGAVASG